MSKKNRRKHSRQQASKVASVYSYGRVPREAFRLGKTQRPVFGGSFTTMKHMQWSLLICCNGMAPAALVYASPQAVQMLPKLIVPQTSPYIKIDWQDLGAPEIGTDFWESLVYGLQHIGRPGPIGVCCVGGTGRTGTALAIIAQLSGAIPAGQCPVAFIRSHYVSDAIESSAQGKYITDITGVDVKTIVEPPYAGPSNYASVYSGHSGISTALKCLHGVAMHLFCPACLQKGGTVSNYKRDW